MIKKYKTTLDVIKWTGLDSEFSIIKEWVNSSPDRPCIEIDLDYKISIIYGFMVFETLHLNYNLCKNINGSIFVLDDYNLNQKYFL